GGVAPRHRPARVLARGRLAGVLGVAEADVRARRADAAAAAVPAVHPTPGRVHTVPGAARRTGIAGAGAWRRGCGRTRARAGAVERRHRDRGALAVPARHRDDDDQRRLTTMKQSSGTLTFVGALATTNLKAALALRGSFLLQAVFMALNNFSFFVFWWALMRN